MQITAEMIEKAKALGEFDRCEICHDTGDMPCINHQPIPMVDGQGAYTWCDTCEKSSDERAEMPCYCQED